MIKMVAFDLDGTIGDTIPMCLQAFEQAISPYAGHRLREEEIVQTLGLNETGMVKKVVHDQWEAALHDFYLVYEKMHSKCPHPCEGIPELIAMLKSRGILVTLVTGKGRESCRITLEQFGMTHTFCAVKTGSENDPDKSRPIIELMQEFHLAKNELYYVGDTVADITASRKAGISCLSAAWGSKADFPALQISNHLSNIFLSVRELRDFLEEKINRTSPEKAY